MLNFVTDVIDRHTLKTIFFHVTDMVVIYIESTIYENNQLIKQ